MLIAIGIEGSKTEAYENKKNITKMKADHKHTKGDTISADVKVEQGKTTLKYGKKPDELRLMIN